LVLTIFHYPIAFFIYRLSRNKLPLYDLVFGAFLIDLEVPVLFILGHYPYRLILHSFLGALLFSVPIALILYPPTHRILELMRIKAPNKIRSYFSIIIGAESHVLLDTLNHAYNPLFWPFKKDPYVGLIIFEDLQLASFIMHSVMIPLTLIIFFRAYRTSKNISKALTKMLNNI